MVFYQCEKLYERSLPFLISPTHLTPHPDTHFQCLQEILEYLSPGMGFEESVYDPEGSHHGSYYSAAAWRPAPGGWAGGTGSAPLHSPLHSPCNRSMRSQHG